MITAALVGNPNVGKTSLFNILTGSNQYVGNWAGVTVEKKEGYMDNIAKIVDLPGIYAMDTYSNEEKVSKNYLSTENIDVILNIVDASNLERNLYLTYQLKEFRKPIILLLNMMDVVEEKNIKIDFDLLEKELKVKVIPISASKNTGIDKLKELLMTDNFFGIYVDNEFQFRSEEETYSLIEQVLKKAVVCCNPDESSITDKIDNLLLNKFLAYPIFLAILYIIFQFTFSWVGQPLSDLLDEGLNNALIPYLNSSLSSLSPWFKSLLVDGIVGGIGSVIVFLPIILTLFLGISFLEDSGYMSRAAFIMDKLMRRMGLSGKAFIPLIIGFGCSVPGIMASRTLESEKDRKLTALLVPLMSCNARLPVYALFASVFFPGNETLIVFSLYLLGILIAFLIGILFKNTLFKKDEEPFIIELSPYKMPGFKSLTKLTWEKGKGFLKKAGTIIFAASVVIWFLSNFNFTGMVEMNDSLLASIGKLIAPIFKPLGFGSWENSVAILTGITAKEIILSSMGVIYGGNLREVLPNHFTVLSSYSFLVFVLLYTPCVSVVAAMKKEYGSKMMYFSIFYQLILAWIVSFIVYNIGLLLI
ncbi:ferrous iron transport protein B [Clostridium cochlearium]|jgi:ferrous iron transport protein B|uniref:Ferrous iron transport protein B n=1 Tax=Clostridium cochlearium TaxID=1494 RepID=A0A239ZNG2_CLOCO|nr:ferrous iron transport protein B [Clostridium cochlearium]NSJ92017.1 ferrous iron transport protein B [Coprococcus sp. MSK.21.13]MBE6064064.1 ferrous iron transport protein B [Clostridium cochlearium]MBU5270505.1 ferrous iron transport protein B [Clostridium cochlearium]MCR1971293.1 ferrous iron transport protein B [Clostridium cochlearium]MDU1443953.1 ferrous iron transport protein B [Clostridium cochlearium]